MESPVRPSHHHEHQCTVCGLDMHGGWLSMMSFKPEGEMSVEVQEEEEEPAQHFKDPGQPHPDDVEQHRTDGHYPYRNWCRWCVLGRGLGAPHRRQEGTSTIPRIGVDYFFMTRGELKARKEMEDDGKPMNDEEVEKNTP